MESVKKYQEAAFEWFEFGLQVIPVPLGTKRTAVKWDHWLSNLSDETIITHWEKHPDHEVGFIVGDGIIVFDADSTEAIASLTMLEWEHAVTPNMVVKTKRGEHHYFRKTSGVFAKTSGHGSESPDQMIDVKTGKTMVVLPPSTGKALFIDDAKEAVDLVEATQTFIDAVYIHKGQQAPRPRKPLSVPRLNPEPNNESIANINALLETIDPGCCREEWLKALMAIFYETGGSDEGFKLADNWSSRGKNYTGEKDTLTAWQSFSLEITNPVTIGTLIKMAKDNGADMEAVITASMPDFEICETKIVDIEKPDNKLVAPKTERTQPEGTIFDKFSLTGMSEQLEKDALEQVPVLGEFALLGQTTVLCAEGNTGKTLITLKLLTEAILAGRIDATKVYYLNMDDDYKGLIDKVKIAEEFGFNMLAEGYEKFTASTFLDHIRDLINRNQTRGVIVILDTLKKFVDLMKKSECRGFNTVLREFSSKGGTIIALAHTNKNKNNDGRPVFAGTSDLKDDFDCMYLLSLISERGEREKVVQFEKEKGRGPVVEKAAYRYISDNSTSYTEMLLSVQEVNDSQLLALKQAEEIRSDAEVISAVIACINEGSNTKMILAEAAANRSGSSKRSVLVLIDKYTGKDPAQHQWFFVRGERGKQTFSVLESTND